MRWVRRKWAEVEAWLGPLRSGALLGVAAVLGVAFALFEIGILWELPSPAASLLNDLGQFGGALFIAFSVAFAGAGISDHWDRAKRQNWVGFGLGVGLAGFLAAGSAFATAAHIEAGHSGALDLGGLAVAVAGALMMGMLVIALAAAALLDE